MGHSVRHHKNRAPVLLAVGVLVTAAFLNAPQKATKLILRKTPGGAWYAQAWNANAFVIV
jgi:hypothetical protein